MTHAVLAGTHAALVRVEQHDPDSAAVGVACVAGLDEVLARSHGELAGRGDADAELRGHRFRALVVELAREQHLALADGQAGEVLHEPPHGLLLPQHALGVLAASTGECAVGG